MCDTGFPRKQVRAPFVLARGAVVGSLGDPCAPCLLVPGCRSSLQKVLAEGVVFLTALPQGFGFTRPGESNKHFVTPKLEVQVSLMPLPLQSPTLFLTVMLAPTRWLCTCSASVQQPGRKQNKQQQNLHSFVPHQ